MSDWQIEQQMGRIETLETENAALRAEVSQVRQNYWHVVWALAVAFSLSIWACLFLAVLYWRG